MTVQSIDKFISDQVEGQVKEIIGTELKSAIEGFVFCVYPEYMTYKQASEYLGISIGTLRKYVSQYGLPVIKIENVTRLKKSDIDEFMEMNRV
ncbi:helix-turn-helix domain-containing protein [Enterococcus sp. BWB1-3]|uniref:helix-turn-helix domain-containing protein n=1 Tax=Enterococcus sp. BWB1-3 TaxID=2787713 RepID=UPI0019207065|nr:helix-turn-helix domain-containing protein [Enterococcus sp. BWB1-3]MBL1229340.1 helix-turn-helix domain-containing protein [Enterococcus sp. BWB1-3]